MEKKKVLFISGTRADYGKIKPLMKVLDASDNFSVYVFVCGMHLLEKFGGTYREIQKDGYENIYVAHDLQQGHDGSTNLGNTIIALSTYLESVKPDLLLVHGDRMDALAGAVVGALRNILVGHIEGGEISGTIDESTRHAISKFAHIHFVCTEEAKNRLIQLGEEKNRIFVIGSPDIDIMMNDSLPALAVVKERYEIPFDTYGVMMYHPVTTEYEMAGEKAREMVDAVIESGKNYVVVYPNNDLGSEDILKEYERFQENSHFRVFPSLRFEFFLTLLKNAEFIIGNSSAGIRESGIYGVPAIDIGTRQSGRYSEKKVGNIIHTDEKKDEILNAISHCSEKRTSSFVFGDGRSTEKFMQIVSDKAFWNMKIQKRFVDLDM